MALNVGRKAQKRNDFSDGLVRYRFLQAPQSKVQKTAKSYTKKQPQLGAGAAFLSYGSHIQRSANVLWTLGSFSGGTGKAALFLLHSLSGGKNVREPEWATQGKG
jgi:hypothetical protein